MHEAFATIEFGPFASNYHRQAVDARFKEALSDYLQRELLPQVEEHFDTTRGSLVPVFADDKYCGPHSAVRNLYKLEFSFARRGSEDTVSIELLYDSERRVFRPRYRHQRLILFTRRRQEEHRAFCEVIESMVTDMQSATSREWRCPKCGTVLQVTDTPSLFDLSCPRMCFDYNYHRDPDSGEFLHGHFLTSPERGPEETDERSNPDLQVRPMAPPTRGSDT